MQSDPLFSEVSESVPVRQGDIIRSNNLDGRGSHGWAIVMTADCDIAQSKMGSFLTCLEIVTAVDYITHFWASDEVQKLLAKLERRAIRLIHAADSKRDPNVSMLKAGDLEAWLREESPSAIVSRLPFTKHDGAECLQALNVLRLARDNSDSALSRLKGIWSELKRSKKDQEGAIANSLKLGHMRSDYVLLPGLPGEKASGFVVLLRAVRPIAPSRIFPSALALRISGSGSDFYRLGRLADFLRYSIAQQWASLYSRIGMTAQFEEQCDEVVGVLVTDML